MDTIIDKNTENLYFIKQIIELLPIGQKLRYFKFSILKIYQKIWVYPDIYINKSKSFSKFSGKLIKAFRAFGWARRAIPMDPKAAALRRG